LDAGQAKNAIDSEGRLISTASLPIKFGSLQHVVKDALERLVVHVDAKMRCFR